MHFLGFILYFIVIYGVLEVKAINEMLEQALLLAPELTYMMLSIYAYPFIIAVVHIIFKQNSIAHSAFLKSQTLLSASVVVSLGLIGTFQGLTMMVTAIATSMGGDGDITEKMGAMISSISEALSAMSYAFLTSIFGVAISVLLLISHNLWNLYYISEYTNTEDEELILQSLHTLNEISAKLYDKLNVTTLDEKQVDRFCAHLDEIKTGYQTYQGTVIEHLDLTTAAIQSWHEANQNIEELELNSFNRLNDTLSELLEETRNSNQDRERQQKEITTLAEQLKTTITDEKQKWTKKIRAFVNDD